MFIKPEENNITHYNYAFFKKCKLHKYKCNTDMLPKFTVTFGFVFCA